MKITVFDNHENLVDVSEVEDASVCDQIEAITKWIKSFNFHKENGVWPPNNGLLASEKVGTDIFNIRLGTRVVYTVFFEE